MSPTARSTLPWVSALLALVSLISCGGGAEPNAQSVPQSLGFGTPANQTFGAAPLTLAATATSGLAVSFSSSPSAVCTVSGTLLTVVGAGTCAVTASQAGNTVYAAATPVTNSFSVLAAPQAITFLTPGNQTLGTTPGALVATATSGLAVGFASSTPVVCGVNGTVLTLLASGTCTVVASQPGNTNYLAAAGVSHSFSVSAVLLAQALDFPSPGNQTLGTSPAPLAATASSGLGVAFASLTPAVCTVSGSALTLVSAGTCTAAASQAGDATYAAAATVQRSFTVARATQTISFTSPGNQTLGTATPALAAGASSGLLVVFASTTPAVCTASGTTLTLVAVGTCSLDASQAGNVTYAPAATVTRTFTVVLPTPAAQTISFASPGNQTLGSAPAPLVASASSGLTVSFASTTPSTCTVSGTTLTLVAAGTCIIDANQAGNSAYAAAATVSRVITIAAAPLTAQTLTFNSPGNQTLGSPPPALVASSSSGLPVSFSSTTPSTCSVSGSTLTLVAAGTCIVDASQAGNSVYAAAATVSRVFTISAAAQTITFASPGNQTLGSAPAALVASSSSGLPVSFASTTPSTCSASGTTLTLVAAGTCIIDASQAGNSIYSAAVTVSRVFTVAKASQAITFASPGSQTLGTPPPPLAASASSSLAVTFTSTTLATCTVNGRTLTLVTAGTCTIVASQAGNSTYAPASDVTRSISISTAPLIAQSITFTSPATQTLGTAPAPLSATASSGLAVSFASTTPAVCTVSGSTLALVVAGTCTVTASQDGNATYAAAASVTNSFAVVSATQTITFNSPGNQMLGVTPAPLAATSTSGLTVSFTSTTTSVCTVSGNTLALLAAGTCTVEANQAGNAVFAAAAPVGRSFSVAPGSQTITFASPGNQTLGATPTALVASASSSLPVTFTSTTPSICAVSGSTLTLLAAGTCSIDASQAGNANFAAAATVSRAFNVLRALQSISFTSPGNQTLGTPPPALSAISSSGLMVSFTSTTPSVCTASGSTLTLVAVGSCSIDASQAGNATYAAATPVTQTFTVAAAPLTPQTITFASPGDQTLRITPPALVASASSGLAVSIASTTLSVCTVSGSTLTLLAAGTCRLSASQGGDATYAAATAVSNSFAVLAYELFANGGFETVGATTPANAWLQAASGYSRSSDSHTGAFSARLSSPQLSAAVVLQNSVEQGARLPLVVGSTPTLTFWAKGFAGTTGNVLFALRYLDSVGNIKANSNNQFFDASINPNTWTKITYTLPGGVPAGATAAFIEFSQAIGPIDPATGLLAGEVLIDDLSLAVVP